jgi:hypothetical protein
MPAAAAARKSEVASRPSSGTYIVAITAFPHL